MQKTQYKMQIFLLNKSVKSWTDLVLLGPIWFCKLYTSSGNNLVFIRIQLQVRVFLTPTHLVVYNMQNPSLTGKVLPQGGASHKLTCTGLPNHAV